MLKIRAKVVLSGLLVVLIIISMGCSARLLDFTIISSKNVNMQVPDASKGNRVTGVDKVTSILGIPLGTANLKEAVDRAIEKAGPGYDALVDGVIYAVSKFYILFGSSGYQVEGTPIKSKDFRSSGMPEDRILFHSSLGLDNSKALEVTPVVISPEQKK